MAVKPSTFGVCPQFELATGAPANGYKLFTCLAGTNTKVNTFTDSTGGTVNPNPIILNALGQTPNEYWWTTGQAYKMIWALDTDTDPPSSPLRTWDNLTAMNDVTVSAAAQVYPRVYIDGFNFSTSGPSTTMNIGAGQVQSSLLNASITLSSAMGKTTAAWSAGTGNGGLDTGAIANNTWYHWYVIMRPDTSVVDIAFSTSASAPTTGGNIPTAYTKFHRIGSTKTNGAGQWTPIYSVGDRFNWAAVVQDYDNNTHAGAAVLQALTIPTGVSMRPMINFAQEFASSAQSLYVWSPLAGTTNAVGERVFTINSSSVGAGWGVGYTESIRSDTSGRIYFQAGAALTNVDIYTSGWIDSRGKDA